MYHEKKIIYAIKGKSPWYIVMYAIGGAHYFLPHCYIVQGRRKILQRGWAGP